MMKSLENHFLIATPSMRDPFFAKSVTYICEHNDEGAMGLIINQPLGIKLDELLDQVEIDCDDSNLCARSVYAGGPVQTDRGFVLHSPQPGWSSSLQLADGLMVTTSKDILAALGAGNAPNEYIVTLGYAGWEAGQLEQELLDNAWLTVPADPEILFATPVEKRWEVAMSRLGFDLAQFSPDVGHA